MVEIKKYMHIVLLAAFILSGVSPACKFISGDGVMLICGADGSVKAADIPEEFLAYLPGQQRDNQQERNNAERMNGECGFCFASDNLKQFTVASATFPFLGAGGYLKYGSGSYVPAGQLLKPYDSQGPPLASV